MASRHSLHYPPPTFEGTYSNAGIRILHCNRRRTKDWNFPDLTAPYWRFYWNDATGAEVVFGGEVIPLKSDCFYLIPPETPFASRGHLNFNHFYIHFTAKTPFDAGRPGIYDITAGSDYLNYAAETLAQTVASLGSRPSAPLQMRYNALLCYALSMLPPTVIEELPRDERITKIIACMAENLDRKVSSDELAAAANISPQTLFRIFSQELGISPQDYFKNMKINQACFCLHFSERTIDEIAAHLGFADRYHFTKVFTSIRKISPAAYRKLS